jgi:hypothetical protein
MHRLVFCGFIVAMFAGAMCAGAADLAGTWQNEMQGRGGQTFVTTCVFKVDGNKVTGTYATQQRAFDIDKGTLDGAAFSFQTYRRLSDSAASHRVQGHAERRPVRAHRRGLPAGGGRKGRAPSRESRRTWCFIHRPN